MATLDDVLGKKGRDVYTITPESTVHEAVAALCLHRIGALLVVETGEDGERLLGIVSERDVLEEVNERSDAVKERTVADIMTRDLIVCLPNDEVDYAMAVMTDRRIRHLPIVVEGEIRGIISIGDLVKAKADEFAHENLLLHHYIADDYPR